PTPTCNTCVITTGGGTNMTCYSHCATGGFGYPNCAIGAGAK
ncbi:unnamed protein product, partial [Rotaria sp. Silwood2]